MQVHNRYLITENESGILVIDQHALHERILYEQLREKVLAGTLEKQRLLVPEPMNLTPAEAGAALGAKDTLAQLGIEIEPFGGDTVLVSTYPAMLANFDPSEVLRQLALGLTNKEIALALHISYETVKEHVQHILRKVGVSDRTQAAVWAVRKGLA